MLGRGRTADDLVHLIGLQELMQERDTLGRRRQTADGGWLDVFTRGGRMGRRRTRARREAWTGAVASR